MPSFLVGLRDGEHARVFVDDLAGCLSGRVQITIDGLRAYVEAIDLSFGGEVNYAVLHKVYGSPRDGEARYSPAECVGCEKRGVSGNPDLDHVPTSSIERQNLTFRMWNRRFTRLSNAFSNQLENHEHAIALYFFAYIFIFRHGTLRMLPALKAKLTDHVWNYEELVGPIDRADLENRCRIPN